MLRHGIPVTTDHPQDPRLGEATGLRVTEAALLVALAVPLAIFLYQAQFSGAIRWVLGVASVSLLAAIAWSQILRRTEEPPPLVGPEDPEAYGEGELESLAAAADRASRGLSYSQVLVTSRARAAFLERVRLVVGLSPEAMRDVQRDPARLRKILGDPILAEFVHLRIGDLEERYEWVVQARERAGFASEFRDVLARMEAWR